VSDSISYKMSISSVKESGTLILEPHPDADNYNSEIYSRLEDHSLLTPTLFGYAFVSYPAR